MRSWAQSTAKRPCARTPVRPPVFFFFPVKKKSARENRFWNFLDFFHGHFSFFTPTFWPIFQIFHAHDFFFHGQFFRFFHGKKITFHGQKIWYFSFCLNYDQSIGKTLKKTCFSNILKKIFVFFHGHFCSFTGIVFSFFSRAWIWVSRAKFDEKFHGHFCVFTCTF